MSARGGEGEGSKAKQQDEAAECATDCGRAARGIKKPVGEKLGEPAVCFVLGHAIHVTPAGAGGGARVRLWLARSDWPSECTRAQPGQSPSA